MNPLDLIVVIEGTYFCMDLPVFKDRSEERDRLLDENEQLSTALENALEDNAALAEDRDRLLRRVTMLARELQSANSAYVGAQPSIVTATATATEAERDARQSQTEEELRVAFEELQALTEELEVANTSLQATNGQLEARVEERTRELAATNAALHKSESAFRTLIEGMPQLPWRSRNNGQWTWSSPQWSEYTGQSFEESLDYGWLDVVHPDDRARVTDAWADAGSAKLLKFEYRIYHALEDRHRHFRTRAAPVRADDGRVMEWLGTSTDVDDIVQLRERQNVLVGELQHRTRNLMAVVQAVTLRTIKGSRSLDEFRRCIDDRMQALSRVQSLLSRRGHGKVSFDTLLLEELSSQVELDEMGNGEQVRTSGPRGVPLQSGIVQTLALALHELLTNAVKHGALATPRGHINVRWECLRQSTSAPQLRIEWTESNVALSSVDMNKPGGYGRELIERALPYQLGAKTSFSFAADGIHCSIEVPLLFEDVSQENNA